MQQTGIAPVTLLLRRSESFHTSVKLSIPVLERACAAQSELDALVSVLVGILDPESSFHAFEFGLLLV